MRHWLETFSRSPEPEVARIAASALRLQEALASERVLDRAAAAAKYVSLTETLLSRTNSPDPPRRGRCT
jgi:hypothetical protein